MTDAAERHRKRQTLMNFGVNPDLIDQLDKLSLLQPAIESVQRVQVGDRNVVASRILTEALERLRDAL